MDASSNNETIRLLTLNLQHGGGNRIDRIAELVLSHRPDIAILTEYRATTGPALSAKLAAGGLLHQASSEPERPKNGVFVAAHLPFTVVREPKYPSPSPRHWLELQFESFRLGAIYLGVNREEYGDFLDWLVDLINRRMLSSFILAGDFNWLEMGDGGNGVPGMVEELSAAGYTDAWRKLNPTGRDYSWTNHNGTRTRVDYMFLSRRVAPYLTHARYDHDGQNGKVSDHDLLIVEMISPISRTAGLIGRLRSSLGRSSRSDRE
jgi:exodeoxyribonuclease III